jgi:hypothetical protein
MIGKKMGQSHNIGMINNPTINQTLASLKDQNYPTKHNELSEVERYINSIYY